MRKFFRWTYFPTVACIVAVGAYFIAEKTFGPYPHWTLWVRGPIATAVTVAFLWVYVGRHLWRALRDW